MLRAAVSLLHSWDRSWPLVLALCCRALRSKPTGLHAGAFRRGRLEERRRAPGWERKKQREKEPDGEYGKDGRCAGRQGGNKQTGWRNGEKAGETTVRVLRQVWVCFRCGGWKGDEEGWDGWRTAGCLGQPVSALGKGWSDAAPRYGAQMSGLAFQTRTSLRCYRYLAKIWWTIKPRWKRSSYPRTEEYQWQKTVLNL